MHIYYIYVFTYLRMYKCDYIHLCLIFTYFIHIYNINLLQKKKKVHPYNETRTNRIKKHLVYQRRNGIHSLTLWDSKFWKTLDFGVDV